MVDTFITNYLDDAARQFHQLKSLAEKGIVQVGDEELFTVLDEEANSIAVLLKHMAGSMHTRWKNFPTSAEEDAHRDRDSEFRIEAGDTKRALTERWEAGWQCLFDALKRLTPEAVHQIVPIRGQPHSVIEAINRQLTHYAYHVGQIVLLAKHCRSSAWQSLSIPRGKSSAFEARMHSRDGT